MDNETRRNDSTTDDAKAQALAAFDAAFADFQASATRANLALAAGRLPEPHDCPRARNRRLARAQALLAEELVR